MHQEHNSMPFRGYILKDKQGRFGRISTRNIPHRVRNCAPAIKEVGGEVIKGRADWPEDELQIELVNMVKSGFHVKGYKGQDFELMVGPIRLGDAAKPRG